MSERRARTTNAAAGEAIDLGTPTHLVDPDAATVAGRASVGLWGQTSWAGEVSTPLRFPGQYFDAGDWVALQPASVLPAGGWPVLHC